jgi:predicted ATPase
MYVITTVAVENYRSLRRLVVPLGRLTVVTGANGSGKSNLYRALRLLAESSRNGAVAALAREGGLQSTLWAGPEHLGKAVRDGVHPVQGTSRTSPIGLRLGFAGDDFGYAIDLGLPVPSMSAFRLDPEIKRECTLRYLLWVAALLTPRPPVLMVLNEPETSLHPDLLRPLANLIMKAARHTQIVVVTHSRGLLSALDADSASADFAISSLELAKEFGQTQLVGQKKVDEPSWHWPRR